MDPIETAIYESLNPTITQDKRVRALDTLQKAKLADNNWQICLEKLFSTTKVEVRFWCIQTLSDIISSSNWNSLPTHIRLFLRDSLTFYYFGVHLEEGSVSMETKESWKQWRRLFPETFLEVDVPNFVRNKCAQLFSSVVAQEYPHSWPFLFRRLFSILPDSENMKQSLCASDMELLYRFLLVLYCLDEDFISLSAIQHSGEVGTRIRDGLRNDCIQQIVSLPIQLTHLCHISNNKKLEEVYSLSLDICRRFIEWIDISLVTDNIFISTVFSIMIHPEKHFAKSISARIFSEIVSKKMSLERKYQLLHSLNLIEFLSQLGKHINEATLTTNSVVVQESWNVGDYLEQLGYHSFQVEIVILVNTIAAEALELIKASKTHSLPLIDISKVFEWARSCLPLMIKCFQLEDEKICRDTWEFFMIYINNCRNISDDVGCTFILSLIWEHVIFSEEKTLTEERFMQFQQQRGRLVTLFRNICRIYPALAMETIQIHLEKLNERQEWDIKTLEEMECIYYLTNSFVELNHKTKDWDYLVFRILSVLPKLEWFSVLNDSYNSNRQWIMEQLIMTYDDLLGHSMSLIESDMSLIYSVLVYLLDERGLRNPYSFKLRNKAAASLLRIARPLRQMLATHFFELIITNLESTILQASQNGNFPHILDLDRRDYIGIAEKLFLIEVIGLVLGSCWDLGFCNECTTRLEVWLTRLITTLDSCMATQSVPLGCCIIEALTCLAKGFTLDDNREARENGKVSNSSELEAPGTMQEMNNSRLEQDRNVLSPDRSVTNCSASSLSNCWKSCFHLVFQFLQGYGSMSVTREKCLIFLHRMVETLGEEALPFLQSSCLELITLHSNPTELTDIFLLVNQIIVRLKKNARSFLFSIFHPLLKSFSDHFQSNNNERLQCLMEDPLHSRSEIWRENIELLKTFHLFLYHVVSQQLEDVLLLPSHQPFTLVCLGMLVDAVSISSDISEFHWTECKYAWIVVRKLLVHPDTDTFRLDGCTLKQWIVQTFVPLSLLLLFRLDWNKSNKAKVGIVEEIANFYIACKSCFSMNPDWETCFQQSLSKLPQIPFQLCQELLLVCQQQDNKSIYALLTEIISKNENFSL